MKKKKNLRFLLLAIFFQTFSFNVIAQDQLKAPSQSSDTISISNSGIYIYQNQVIEKYRQLKPLLNHYPESRIQNSNASRNLLKAGLFIGAGLTNVLFLNFVNKQRQVLYKKELRELRPFFNPPDKPKNAMNLFSLLPPTLFTGFAIYKISIDQKKKNLAIAKFNEVVKRKF